MASALYHPARLPAGKNDGVQSGIYFLKIRSVKSPRSGLPIHAPTAKAMMYPEAMARKEIT
jgi:hypothetical protein